jgi:hypothetical protein
MVLIKMREMWDLDTSIQKGRPTGAVTSQNLRFRTPEIYIASGDNCWWVSLRWPCCELTLTIYVQGTALNPIWPLNTWPTSENWHTAKEPNPRSNSCLWSASPKVETENALIKWPLNRCSKVLEMSLVIREHIIRNNMCQSVLFAKQATSLFTNGRREEHGKDKWTCIAKRCLHLSSKTP